MVSRSSGEGERERDKRDDGSCDENDDDE